MKKLFAILVLVGVLTLNVKAESLRFVNKNGLELTIEIKKEKEDTVPVFVKRNSVYQIFDLSDMIKPEKEDELPPFIRSIKAELKKY